MSTDTMSSWATMVAENQKRVAELQEARNQLLAADIAANPCCREYNADGLLRAREKGYEWEPALCHQHRQWEKISWMIHNGTRGMSPGQFQEMS